MQEAMKQRMKEWKNERAIESENGTMKAWKNE